MKNKIYWNSKSKHTAIMGKEKYKEDKSRNNLKNNNNNVLSKYGSLIFSFSIFFSFYFVILFRKITIIIFINSICLKIK